MTIIGMTFGLRNVASLSDDGVLAMTLATFPDGEGRHVTVSFTNDVIAAAGMTPQQIVDISLELAQYLRVEVTATEDPNTWVAKSIVGVNDHEYSYVEARQDKLVLTDFFAAHAEQGADVALTSAQATMVSVVMGARTKMTIREARKMMATFEIAKAA